MRMSTRWRIVLFSLLALLVSVAILSRKYLWLYASRKVAPNSQVSDLLHDPESSTNPEKLLAEANRLAWLFNWPKAGPLYVRAEELFGERADARNEIYARVGRIRAQSEAMSWVDVSQTLGQQLNIPVVKTDLAAKKTRRDSAPVPERKSGIWVAPTRSSTSFRSFSARRPRCISTLSLEVESNARPSCV